MASIRTFDNQETTGLYEYLTCEDGMLHFYAKYRIRNGCTVHHHMENQINCLRMRVNHLR